MMNMWICALLLIAVYCTIAGACGGSTNTAMDRACTIGIPYAARESYSSCYTSWWSRRRTCNTRFKIVIKKKTHYYCLKGYIQVNMSSSIYCAIPPPPTCGISKYPDAGANYINANIVGGKDARKNEFPWQVSLQTEEQISFCGGTILNATTILTAAHCVRGKAADTVFVHAGIHDIRVKDGTERVRVGKSILSHPNYNPRTINNDVALITLSNPLTLDDNVRAACLPAKTFSVADKDVVISGFGRLSTAGATPPILQYTVVRVVPWRMCNMFPEAADALCVSDTRGDTVRSACFGDSGGPMVIKSEGKWLVVGVTSYVSGRGCAAGDPFGYRSVMYHDDFIRYGKVTQIA